jgi:alpha-amylase
MLNFANTIMSFSKPVAAMRNCTLSLLFCFIFGAVSAQNIDLTMQAWYWDYFQNGNFGTWVTGLDAKATELKNAGFKNIWLPPLSRSSNADNISNGYNPKDLYDLGQYGPACAWGTRAQLNTLITDYNANGLNVVSDMIFNHRDGGAPEKNTAVKYFVTSTSNAAVYPSDRFFCVLPLGSANPGNNGAGDYYIKVKSKSQNYSNSTYTFYAKTHNTAYQGTVNETEPNGGGDCNEGQSQVYTLGYDVVASTGPDANGCWVDEYKITLTGSNFIATDDTLFIYLNNSGGYSDHYVYGIWSASKAADIVGQLEYWTYTNFNGLPSGQGGINYNGFRPNDNTANANGITETFSWPQNFPLFFYDYDQSQQITRDLLNNWTKWELNQGIKGLRMDAVKHFDPEFVGQLMTFLYDNGAIPQFVVGEYFDYDPGLVNGWINDVYSNMSTAAKSAIKVRAFDFALRQALKNACDTYGNDVRAIFNSGIVNAAGGSPFNVVAFVDNHDLRQNGEGIQNDAVLAYAYILTNNQIGAPAVFYPDYYGVQVGNTPLIFLKQKINDLVTLHKTYIYGSPQEDYLSRSSTPYYQYFVPNGNNGTPQTTLIYQIKPNGTGKNVIVAINFSGTPLDVYQGINTSWGASAGTTFTDMLGFSGTQNTNITNNNEIHVTLPPRSYTVYVQGVNTPLPIELLDFQAFAERESVLLKWRSGDQQNFDHFEIERSTGDVDHFGAIGTVAGIKNEDAYSWPDDQAPRNTTLYYRLKMVDADGKFTYSPIRHAVLNRRSFEAYVAPVPATAGTKLFLNTLHAQNFHLTAINALGMVVYQQEIETAAGENTVLLPILPAGIYSLRIEGESEQTVLQICAVSH